jgi:mRNA-degrading endonuclease RelE of RelBE toxin-antitoxin system
VLHNLNDRAEFPGDRLSGLSVTAFKVRVKNSDIQKGKSAGYRLIYQVETPIKITLLTIYSKSDQSNIDAKEIEQIVEAVKRQNEESSGL